MDEGLGGMQLGDAADEERGWSTLGRWVVHVRKVGGPR